ncbi:hypothetical protein T492DRAFT_873556 [Pavlovales sp. CCMP2436]|nr:hypothetical protein T492DRAFT_873556 [Pavlovales sp. CCMP2436]
MSQVVPLALSSSSSHYATFLSHDWGVNNVNHSRVVEVACLLQTMGVVPWVDAEQLHSGNVQNTLTKGLDDSATVVVFVTQAYMDKVAGNGIKGDEDNWCRARAARVLTAVAGCSRRPRAYEKHLWHGIVGAKLGGELYIDMSGAITRVGVQMLANRIMKTGGGARARLCDDVGCAALTDEGAIISPAHVSGRHCRSAGATAGVACCMVTSLLIFPISMLGLLLSEVKYSVVPIQRQR